MNVKTKGASRRYSRRVTMRLVIEIRDGLVYSLAATGPCEIAIIDRDVERMLPEGESGYASIWSPDIDEAAVDEAFGVADP